MARGDSFREPLYVHARSDLTGGSAAVVQRSDMVGLSARSFATPKFAAIDLEDADDATIVAAVTGAKIRVLSYMLAADGTTTLTWKSGSTALSGAVPASAGLPISQHGIHGLVETAENEALVLSSSGEGVAVAGHLTYIEVPA